MSSLFLNDFILFGEQAADLFFELLPTEASDLTSLFGLPTDAQRRRAERVADGLAEGAVQARGLADAMSDRVCYLYTVGFLQYLEKIEAIHPGDSVALAGDFRPSTRRIMAAAAAAIMDLGYQPANCGNIPTPAVVNYAIAEGIPSLMVTGSHIPDDRNGIKFNRPDGEILKPDEARIRARTSWSFQNRGFRS